MSDWYVYPKNKVYPIAARLPPGCVARGVRWHLDRLRRSFFPQAVRKVSFTLIHPECFAIKWDLQFTILPASKHLEGEIVWLLYKINRSHKDYKNTDKSNMCNIIVFICAVHWHSPRSATKVTSGDERGELIGWTHKNSPDAMQKLPGFTLSYVLVQWLKVSKSTRQFKALQMFLGFHSFVSVIVSHLCLHHSLNWSYIVWLWVGFTGFIYLFFSRSVEASGTQAAPSATSCCLAASGALLDLAIGLVLRFYVLIMAESTQLQPELGWLREVGDRG